jgi:hypothetical protein
MVNIVDDPLLPITKNSALLMFYCMKPSLHLILHGMILNQSFFSPDGAPEQHAQHSE